MILTLSYTAIDRIESFLFDSPCSNTVKHEFGIKTAIYLQKMAIKT